MDAKQANLTDQAWSALLQLANRHSEEALQLLRDAFKAEAEDLGDRDEAKLHLAETWASAYASADTETLSILAGLNPAERDCVAAAVLLHRSGADASKVLWRVAKAVAPDAETQADILDFPPT